MGSRSTVHSLLLASLCSQEPDDIGTLAHSFTTRSALLDPTTIQAPCGLMREVFRLANSFRACLQGPTLNRLQVLESVDDC